MKTITISKRVLLFAVILLFVEECKKTPGNDGGNGNGNGNGNGTETVEIVYHRSIHRLQIRSDFFLDDWPSKTFTIPAYVDTTTVMANTD